MANQTLQPANDVDQIAQYRAINPFAVVALVLGILSSLALIYQPLWVLPLVGIGSALISIRQIRSSGSQIGQGAAFTAIVLAVFFLTATFTRDRVRPWIVVHQAREFNEHFLELLRLNNHESAHQLTLPFPHRQSNQTDLKVFYHKNKNANDDLATFLQKQPLSKWTVNAQQGQISFRSLDRYERHGKVDYVIQTFQTIPPAHDDSTLLQMLCKRTIDDENGQVVWQVTEWHTPSGQSNGFNRDH